jgi:hypothetical protein
MLRVRVEELEVGLSWGHVASEKCGAVVLLSA